MKSWVVQLYLKKRIKELMEDQTMNNIVKAMSGKKTYLTAVLIGILATFEHLGYIDKETSKTIFEMLVGLGLAALKASK
jgi:hypothetical protein